MKRWLPGIAIGALAATAVNNIPLLPQAARAAVTPASTQKCSRQQEAANKALIRSIITPQQLYAAQSPAYVQHSETFKRLGAINGVSDHEAFKLMGEANQILGTRPPDQLDPNAPKTNPFYKLIAECDLVVLLRQQWGPDPQHPGKYYEYFGADVLRIKDGKFVEHWDTDPIPTPLPEFLKYSIKDLRAGKR